MSTNEVVHRGGRHWHSRQVRTRLATLTLLSFLKAPALNQFGATLLSGLILHRCMYTYAGGIEGEWRRDGWNRTRMRVEGNHVTPSPRDRSGLARLIPHTSSPLPTRKLGALLGKKGRTTVVAFSISAHGHVIRLYRSASPCTEPTFFPNTQL